MYAINPEDAKRRRYLHYLVQSNNSWRQSLMSLRRYYVG